MKLAAKSLTVYNSSGEYAIGTLTNGDTIQEIRETPSGILFAYIVGLIKSKDTVALANPEEWVEAANQKQEFSGFIAEQIGALYVSGAKGQIMTSMMIRKMEKGAANYRRAIQHYNEHVKTGQKIIAYDCSGLIVKFLMDHSLISCNRNANDLYHMECSDLCKKDLMSGDLVFKKSFAKNHMYHVGVYMGDGSVIHAKNRDEGVIRELFGTTGWNRFGRLKCWEGARKAVVYWRPILKTGKPFAMGDDVRLVQTALEKKGYYVGAIDGTYNAKTQKAVVSFQKHKGLTADGIIGPQTWAALIE